MRIFQLLNGGLRRLNLYQANATGLVIGFIIVLTFIDVVGRKFGHPVPVTANICSLAMAIGVFLSWSYTQAERGHISVYVLVEQFHPRVKAILDLLGLLIGLMVAIAIAWLGVRFGLDSLASGEIIDIIDTPLFGFKLVMAWGGLTLGLQFAADIVDACKVVRDSWK
jgi:TRAP-type C4-dicarboxylate transport system permease small subunit